MKTLKENACNRYVYEYDRCMYVSKEHNTHYTLHITHTACLLLQSPFIKEIKESEKEKKRKTSKKEHTALERTQSRTLIYTTE